MMAMSSLLFFCVLATLPARALEVTFSIDTTSESLEDDLRSSSLLSALRSNRSSNAQDALSAARADYQRLTSTLYRNAYFAPIIHIFLDGKEAAAVSLLEAPELYSKAVVEIKPGPRFRFGEAKIGPLAQGTSLPEAFQSNKIARVDVIKDTAAAAIDRWRELGFAKASIGQQRITARHKDAQLDADVLIETGPKLSFGILRVTGNEGVSAGRIAEIAGLPQGSVFSPEEIDRATIRLRRTGTFRVAALSEADSIGPNNTIDINADIVEAPLRRFGFGVEISSLEGLALSGFWLHRNVFGGAERLRLEGDISGIGGETSGTDFRFNLRFDRPATFNQDTNFYLETQLERLDEVNFRSRAFDFEAGITRFANINREFSLGIGYRLSETEDIFGERSYAIFKLPASAEFDYRDDKLDAASGFYAKASLTPFLNVRGTENGLLSTLDVRTYKTLSSDNRVVLALRGQAGSIIGPELSEAPSDFLFYSGGGGTVRGQEYQSLSVDVGGGRLTGGRSFLGASSELRVKTGNRLSLVGFYDLGYIGEEAFPDGNSGEWHSGAGVGMRYETGIGPIRLDVGVPISGPGDQSGYEVYIGIGQAF